MVVLVLGGNGEGGAVYPDRTTAHGIDLVRRLREDDEEVLWMVRRHPERVRRDRELSLQSSPNRHGGRGVNPVGGRERDGVVAQEKDRLVHLRGDGHGAADPRPARGIDVEKHGFSHRTRGESGGWRGEPDTGLQGLPRRRRPQPRPNSGGCWCRAGSLRAEPADVPGPTADNAVYGIPTLC